MWDGSVADDAHEQCERFLAESRISALAGARFQKCRDLSNQVARWRAGLSKKLEDAGNFAALVGEPERRDVHAVDRHRRKLAADLARGEELGREWIEAHEGLVDRVWLEKYVESRLWYGRTVSPAILSALAGAKA
jgi:hypothetical protein